MHFCSGIGSEGRLSAHLEQITRLHISICPFYLFAVHSVSAKVIATKAPIGYAEVQMKLQTSITRSRVG